MSKISASTVEYPKRLTAINDCTGALIKSRGTNQEEFASGWDAIWGKKEPVEDKSNIEKAEAYLQSTHEEFKKMLQDSSIDDRGVCAGPLLNDHEK